MAVQGNEQYPLALAAGSILNGRYIVQSVLGQGGFGITYLARDVQTEETVAIKEYFPETLVTRKDGHTVMTYSAQRQENFDYGLRCFLSEAQTLAQFIGVANIVCIHQYFEENSTAYFVMDYIDGISLQTYLEQEGGRIGWERTKTILFPVMDALSEVHARGIIHRDISPDNIILTWDGGVKLLDFGSARYSLGDKSRSLDIVLKHGYAPVEQYTRRGRQGPFTDIYSLAATMYFCQTGRIPPEAIDRMGTDEWIPPSILGSDIPPQAEEALAKALAVQASDRYQSMLDFKQAMKMAEPEEVLLDDQHPLEVIVQTPISQTAKKHQKHRNAAAISIAVICLTAAFGVGGMALFSPGNPGYQWHQYSKAEAAMAAGDYAQANALFEALGNYRDSGEQALQSKYCQAFSLCEKGEFLEANALFESLGDYQNSREQLKSSKYQYACQIAETGSYEEAVELLKEIYSDWTANMEVKKIKYRHASAFAEAGNYGEAASLFESLGAFEDAWEKYQETGYLHARELLKDQEYIEAVALLCDIGDYQAAKALKTQYQWLGCQQGITVTFGAYEQDNDPDNGSEPIEWIVAERQDNKALLISRYILDAMPRGASTWDSSSLRTWLNGTFVKVAFSEEAQRHILTTPVSTPANTHSGLSGGRDTEDQVFLLSAEEYRAYKPLVFYGDTDYAKQKRAKTWDDRLGKGTVWWLRSPGLEQGRPAYVYAGEVIAMKRGFGADMTLGVRPALWIDLDSL